MVLVSSSAAVDQFIIDHPRYFFSTTPESGLINPDNLSILASHVKCGAFELPFVDREAFGPDIGSFLEFLQEQRVVHKAGDRWHWASNSYPAENVSLRSAAPENFVIKNVSDGNRVIGEVDFFSAPMLIHEKAIYMHQSNTFTIDKLDWEARIAHAREVEVDYYTDAVAESDLKVLTVESESPILPRAFGRVAACDARSGAKCMSPRWFPSTRRSNSRPTRTSVSAISTCLPWTCRPKPIRSISHPKPASALQPTCDLGGAVRGLAKLLANVAPVFALCDPRDIRYLAMVRAPFNSLPAVYLYDAYPGGIGIARHIYEHDETILEAALDLADRCICKGGCPSCVGPTLEVGDRCKSAAIDHPSAYLDTHPHAGPRTGDIGAEVTPPLGSGEILHAP